MTLKASIKVLTEGPARFNFQSGDVKSLFVPSGPQPGTQEKKAQLVIEMDEPLNAAGNPFPASYLEALRDDMKTEVYAPGATPDTNILDKARAYTIPNWEQKFSAEELDIIRDPTQTLPDGQTSLGWTVTDGVVSGAFTFDDIKRK